MTKYRDIKINFITRAALIAALYAGLTVAFAPISYGQVQLRISEALTALAFFEPAVVPGLFIGCMIANIYGGLGPWDIFFGSFLTLAAAIMTWRIGAHFLKRPTKGHPHIGALLGLTPPVLFNAFGVALILKMVLGLPYWLSVVYVGLGEAVSVYGLGYPLLLFLLKRGGVPKDGS
ncbi:MAG: QueT transporter family protein [Actinomycetota bacterium]|nr:QueT transporter family protein [Actinomycetota bacterium]